MLTFNSLRDITQEPTYRTTFRVQLAAWTKTHFLRRVAGMSADLLNQKAATLHPACRMGWLKQHPREARQTDRVLTEIENDLRDMVEADLASADDSPGTDSQLSRPDEPTDAVNEMLWSAFSSQPAIRFEATSEEKVEEAKLALRSFLSGHRGKASVAPADFPHPAVKALFIRYNTAVPSSAASERLFSAGRRVITYLRCKLSDAAIEGTMMVSINSEREYSS